MNEEQDSRQKEYSKKIMDYYHDEINVLNSLIDYKRFPDNIASIHDSLLQTSRYIIQSFEGPLITQHKGLIGRIVVFIKRLVRKSTRFLLKPYAETIYQFQTNLLETIGIILEHLSEMSDEKGYSSIISALDNLNTSREIMIMQIGKSTDTLTTIEADIQQRMIQLNFLNNEIDLKMKQLQFVEEKTDAKTKLIMNDIDIRLRELNYIKTNINDLKQEML